MSRSTDPPQRFFLTGSASGIGRHLTKTLLARGAEVWATDVDQAGLDALRSEHSTGTLHTRRLDVTDPAAWQEVFGEAEASGPVDVLLNVAGYLRPSRLADATDQDIDRHLDVNVKGVALGTRTAARAMRERGRGHVINFASLAGLRFSPPARR